VHESVWALVLGLSPGSCYGLVKEAARTSHLLNPAKDSWDTETDMEQAAEPIAHNHDMEVAWSACEVL
jgi:hypothetical protein